MVENEDLHRKKMHVYMCAFSLRHTQILTDDIDDPGNNMNPHEVLWRIFELAERKNNTKQQQQQQQHQQLTTTKTHTSLHYQEFESNLG